MEWKTQYAVRARGGWVSWLTRGVFSLWPALLFAMHVVSSGVAIWLGWLSFLVVWRIGLMLRRSAGGGVMRAREGRVTIDEGALRLGDRSVPLSDIAFAFSDGRYVRFRGPKVTGWFRVPDASEQEGAVDRLGRLPARVPAKIDEPMSGKPSDKVRGIFLVLIVMAVTASLGYGWVVPLLITIVVAIVRALDRRQLEISAAGVALWDGKVVAHFFPWDEVASLGSSSLSGLFVRLKDDRAITYLLPTEGGNVRRAIHARARAALESAEQRPELAEVRARVARGARTADEWVRALLDTGGTFRAQPLPRAELLDLVASPGLDPSTRAGAAALLGHDASDEERARVRIAATTCAEPHLRVVLDKVADGTTDDELAAALRELPDEPAPRPTGHVWR